jgi:hypothetical protein
VGSLTRIETVVSVRVSGRFYSKMPANKRVLAVGWA